jgi:hypothetical protein
MKTGKIKVYSKLHAILFWSWLMVSVTVALGWWVAVLLMVK